MAAKAEQTLAEALDAFDFGDSLISCGRFGEGHINDTFCAAFKTETGERRYILQRISSAAFKNADALMENIVGITEYLRQAIIKSGGDPDRKTLTVIHTKAGKKYYRDTGGEAWRTYTFVENTICLQVVTSPEEFYASAKAFGNFQHLLSEYPANALHETIAKFHDSESRLANFKKALATDACGRAESARSEIDFALAREADYSVCMQALRDGVLPLRVTHNDTKLNNVLFDADTKEVVCVIDLDTVMPGLSINDFGDSIRFGANHSAEDEQNLDRVHFDINLYDIYTKGFLEGAAGSLTENEVAYLPWGAKLMTLECGTRFLTDYLEGDGYFHTTRKGQNLDRARTQFKLVRDMEEQWNCMAQIAKKYV